MAAELKLLGPGPIRKLIGAGDPNTQPGRGVRTWSEGEILTATRITEQMAADVLNAFDQGEQYVVVEASDEWRVLAFAEVRLMHASHVARVQGTIPALEMKSEIQPCSGLFGRPRLVAEFKRDRRLQRPEARKKRNPRRRRARR